MKLNDNLKLKLITNNDENVNKCRNSPIKSFHNRTFNFHSSNLSMFKNNAERAYLNKHQKKDSINNTSRGRNPSTYMSIYKIKESVIPLNYKNIFHMKNIIIDDNNNYKNNFLCNNILYKRKFEK